jgi:hypothetical protein
MLLWPSEAAAQRRGGGGGGRPVVVRTRPVVRTSVVFAAGYYRPYYYRPYFFSPLFYSGFYDPYYYGWYALSAQYPYGPYGRYPYGYGGYRYGAWSSARVEVKPRDAQVYVDGYFVGVVDQFDGVFQRLDLPAGEHELAVYLPGYHTYRERTLFRPGEGYHFKAILEPLPAGAPPEPKPQASPDENRPGPYGREPYRGEEPYGQPPAPRDAPRGRPQPPPERRGENAGFGTLNIRVQPGDAIVQIDGERWDSPEGGSRLSVQLAAGSHRIEVRKDGFRPYSTTIQIRPGEPQTLNISLPQQ